MYKQLILLLTIFSFVSKSFAVWSQSGTDIDGEESGDQAQSVALSADGTTLAIGAPGHDSNKGQVRVYKWNETAWSQSGDIDGKKAGDYAGGSVALSADGTTLAIGAPGHYSNKGHVRMYKWNETAWSPSGNIDGVKAGDSAGDWSTVALSADGTTLAIGAPYHDSNKGHVRVYKNEAVCLQEYCSKKCLVTLVDSSCATQAYVNQEINETYGDCTFFDSEVPTPYDLAYELETYRPEIKQADCPKFQCPDGYTKETGDGTTCIGERSGCTDGTATNYDITATIDDYSCFYGAEDPSTSDDIDGDGIRNENDWDADGDGSIDEFEDGDGIDDDEMYDEVLDPDDMYDDAGYPIFGDDIYGVEEYTYLGSSVALSGDGETLAIGACCGHSYKGNVRVYKWNVTDWSKSVDIDGVEDWDRTGSSVALSEDGDTLAVGEPGHMGSKGRVRIYTRNGTVWSKSGRDIDGVPSSVSLSGDGQTLAIGARGYDERKGRVRIYTWNGTVWSQSVDIDGVDNYAELGSSVSFSANGSTLAVGAPGHDYSKGRVRVYKIEEIMEQRAAELADDGSAEDAATSTKEVYLGLCLENVSLVCVETCHHASLSTDHTLDSGTLDSGWFDWDSLNTYMVCKKACDDGSGDHDSCQIMENHPYFVCLSGDSDICAEMCEKYTNTNDYVNAIFEDLCGAPPSPAPAPPPPSPEPAPAPPPPSPEPADDDATSDDIDGDATSDISACENGHIHSVYSCISACEKGDIHSCLLAVKRYPQTINDIFDLLAANTGSTADQLAADEAHSCVNGSNPDDLREAYNSLQLC